jgi:hypothetical protein
MIVARTERTARSWLTGIGSLLFFFLLVTAIAVGAAIALGATPRPRIIGWPILASSVGLAIWTMEYWARALPGILGCATINGIIITIAGHALNQPSVPVDRGIAAVATLAVGVCAFLAATFKGRRLTMTDRVAGLGLLTSFAVAFSPSKLQIFGLVGIVVCVAIVWAIGRENRLPAH